VAGWAGTAGGIKNDLTKTSPLRIGADPATRILFDVLEKVTRKVAEISLYMGVLVIFSLENGLRYYCTAFFQFEGS
jgi:hypothetical protein